MKTPDRAPVTDAFGTRLDVDELLAGLAAIGHIAPRLVVRDDEIVLECDDPNSWTDDTARGLTWLRAKFSPLVSIRSEKRTENAGGFVDERKHPTRVVALAEVTGPAAPLEPVVEELLKRVGSGRNDVSHGSEIPNIEDPARADLARRLWAAISGRMTHHGWSAGNVTLSIIVPARQGLRIAGPADQGTSGDGGLHFLAWIRPGTERGVRAAALIAASRSLPALHWLGRALCDSQIPHPIGETILIDGLAWKASRRPTIAVPADASERRIQVDHDRCIACGVCAEVCPEQYLRPDGHPATDDVTACTRCYDCIDACPTDAIRPTRAADTAMLASALEHRNGWLSRLAGLPGPSFPAPFPPSYLLPKRSDGNPRYVLGLAIMTMQEHAAVLLRDGRIIGAIEHEKLVRIRHAGWHPPNRPGVTAAVDPTIALEEAFCRRPIRALLEREGITLDDIDVIAINGLHGRYVDRISFIDGEVPVPKVRTGRVVYVPHHLCHAASVCRAFAADDAWVLTVDGRGDRECAAIWRAEHGTLALKGTLLSLTDRSIGGVFEGITRLLGFGSHGQGSLMALAAFGTPTYDLSEFLSIDIDGTVRIHETGITERLAELRREPDQPLNQEHKDLAASVQAALESIVLEFIRRHVGDSQMVGLALGGGVTLNCRMNERLRRTLNPEVIFAQPGANDAGTALGAALEAWSDLGGEPSAAMSDAYLGPEFDDEAIERVLQRSGLKYRRSESVSEDVAHRLADGEVICWFQGRLEFGPRALGTRSILADPRRTDTQDRVNALKQREAWRPFGPSILSGHERDWIEAAFDTRFMLFTMNVRPERRAEVPAVVHVDGTTRPQVVHPDGAPRFHALLSEFHRLTGVPMLLNTSFNRRGEPIVCTPEDAVESFVGLGADSMAIGSFLVERERAQAQPLPVDAELIELPGGRRLALRLTTKCDLNCGHCTLRDQWGRPDRSYDDTLRALVAGRTAGCDELVLLRGEAALRDDLPTLVTAARRMGYRYVQLQTNAAGLANDRVREGLLRAGMDSVEVQVLAAEEKLHDELTGKPGTFRNVLRGVQTLVMAGKDLLATIPVLNGNLRSLAQIVVLLQKLGVRRVQFNFPRPVELPDRIVTAPIPRLARASFCVRQAAMRAQQLGMTVTTEAFPFCHLPPELRVSPDATEEWRRHRIDDLHVVHDSVDAVRYTQRPEALPCRTCSARSSCPKTWALYLELFGSEELVPLS